MSLEEANIIVATLKPLLFGKLSISNTPHDNNFYIELDGEKMPIDKRTAIIFIEKFFDNQYPTK